VSSATSALPAPVARKPPHEVRQIVGQGKKLRPRRVVDELVAGKLRPFHRIPAFLNLLLARSRLVSACTSAKR